MKIATYDEIDPKEPFLLDLICFGGGPTPERVKLIRKLDPDCSDYYGLYALDDDGRAVSQVIVLHVDTETREGREKVAGIAGVATLPGCSRRGLATALMKRAHEMSRERGMRIGVLFTSASLVAYEMYERLGYTTLATLPRGYKRLGGASRGPKKRTRVQFRKFSEKHERRLDELFDNQTRSCLGFVHRQKGLISMVLKTRWSGISPEDIRVAAADGKVVGYVYAERGPDYVRVNEIVGVDNPTRVAMLEHVERESKAKWALCHAVADPRIYRLYENYGYTMYEPGWGRVMAACVDGSLSPEEMADLYGVEESRFVVYALDTF